MGCYVGVVIEQSLRDPGFLDTVDVVLRQRDPNGTWIFLVLRLAEGEAFKAFARLRSALSDGQPWYAHFFHGDELVVVYSDAVFHMTIHPASWAEARSHGRKLGIPEGQLDFQPNTLEQLGERYGIDPATFAL